MKNCTFLILFLSFFAIAQEENQIDSVILGAKRIKEVSIGHPLIQIQHDFGESLGSDLSTQTGAYFKEYGNGMLSSISYRGLGAAHTGVFLEGIPINSGLTGQTDFNLLYPEGFNTIEFRTGGGGATFGSGAVGGSVHLNNELFYDKGFKGNFTQKIASFDTYATHLGVQLSDDVNALKVNLYRLISNNDYDYTYNHKEYTIENGAAENLITHLTYQRKVNHKNQLKWLFNYALADRQLMESVGTTSNQKQKDKNYSSILSWMYTGKDYTHQLSQAFLSEEYQYFPNQNFSNYDFGKTENWITKYDGKYSITPKVNLGAIAQFKHTQGKGSNIEKPTLNEGFVSVYGQYQFHKLRQSLTVSKGVSSEFEIPFTFDYGVELNLKPIKLHGNITTNYRNPTFNDLYWTPGGNPTLKTEDGWATELGVKYERKIDNPLHIVFQTNGFYSKFNDWIVWLPNVSQGGIFTPINVRNVKSYGVELFSQITYKTESMEVAWDANYTFVRSLDEEKNKQLIYTPKHKLNNQLQIRKDKGFVQIQHQLVDEIYTSSDNANTLDAFNLINGSVGYDFKFNTINTAIGVGVNNILDEEYQLILGRAMPKRNYSIQFNINF